MKSLHSDEISQLLCAPEQQVSLNDILATDKLFSRTARAPDYQAEAEALVELSEALASSPEAVLQKISEITMKLCGSDSAGVSIAEVDDGKELFRWRGVSGRLSPYLYQTLPRDFSPCGYVVRTEAPQLMVNLVGHYQYVSDLKMPIHEVLLLPFKSKDTVVGTIWAVAHTPDKKFDAEDLRLMTSLTRFASAAYRARQDATERNEAESRLAMALDASNLGFWSVDLETKEVSLSDRLLQDWGITDFKNEHEMPLKKIHPDDEQRVRTAIQEAIDTKVDYDIEYRVKKTETETVWIHAQGRIKYNQEGKAIQFAGTTLDVTSKKQFEAQLTQAKEEAERANQLKSAFLANMSHEIRTPLAAILGFSTLLKEQDLDPDERISYVETIVRNGNSLTRIIDDILDLAKVDANRLAIEKTEFSIYELATEVVDLFRDKTKQKGIHLLLNIDESVPEWVFSDSARVRQVFVNLIGNAVKFTEYGGVRVNLKREDIDSKQFNLVVEVKDTGVGLSEEQKEKLFQPFSQADNSMTRKFGGTGLGLALSLRLAKVLGGRIWISDSAVDVGTTFKFSFPTAISTRKSAQKKKLEALKVQPLEDLNILVVEDSPDNQFLIDRLLTKNGASVTSASDGFEGLAKAMSGAFDVILMDIQMPGMDGYQTKQALDAREYKRPVIALTAHAMAEEQAKTKSAGFVAHLTKPLIANDVIRSIQNVVSHAK